MTAKTPGETPNVRVGSDGKHRGCGAKGRSGPRQGVPQQNGTSIARLSLGEFPAKLRRLTREARKYRRGLERSCRWRRKTSAIRSCRRGLPT